MGKQQNVKHGFWLLCQILAASAVIMGMSKPLFVVRVRLQRVVAGMMPCCHGIRSHGSFICSLLTWLHKHGCGMSGTVK